MEATVEVLTAEVRALMVGSRQVTLSVYRQLDQVDPFEVPLTEGFEPFGRVRSGTKYPDLDHRDREVSREAHSEFVGKRRADEALARVVIRPGDMISGLEREDLDTITRWNETLPLIVLAGLR